MAGVDMDEKFNKIKYLGKRDIVRKRLKYPNFKYFGNLSGAAMHTLQLYFDDTPPTLESAVKLRMAQLSDDLNPVTEVDVLNYSQHDIQTHSDGAEYVEHNFTVLREEFQHVYEEVSYMLQSPVCRMRYATIDNNDELRYHIDQPGKDRFTVVVQGEQIMHMKTKDDVVVEQLMKPGELWYLNSNWEHKVENTGAGQRLALLGCFDFTNSYTN